MDASGQSGPPSQIQSPPMDMSEGDGMSQGMDQMQQMPGQMPQGPPQQMPTGPKHHKRHKKGR